MTGEICLACGHRRPRANCPIRCGVSMRGPAAQPPAPLHERQGVIALFDALAILILFGMPVVCLHFAGAL